jgi:hypothetical protein
MKPALQILAHVACVVAGFWWAAAESPARERADAARGGAPAPRAGAAIPVVPVKAGGAGLTLEQRLAAVTPETWSEQLGAVTKLTLAELPAALRGALSSRFPAVRRRLVSALFDRWTSLDRASAVAALSLIASPHMKATALRAILLQWTKVDAASAWQWVMSLEDDPVLQEEGIASLLSRSASDDPQSMVRWAERLEDPFLRYKALTEIALAWVHSDPQGALAAALSTDDQVLRAALLRHASYRGERSIDAARAMDLILELPDRAERVKAVCDDWIMAYAGESPDEAMQWFIQRAPHPDLQKAGANLGRLLAQRGKSVAELRHWARQIPAGPARDAFAANAAAEWVATPQRAAEARALLDLCGPCIEREHALETIEAAAKAGNGR